MVNPLRWLKPDVVCVKGKEYHVLRNREGKIVAWLHNDAFMPDARQLEFYGPTDAHLEMDDARERQERARKLKRKAERYGYRYQISIYCFAPIGERMVRRRTDVMFEKLPSKEDMQKVLDFFARNYQRLNETVYCYWKGRIIPAQVHLKFVESMVEAILVPSEWLV
jgi:hypothetical protein